MYPLVRNNFQTLNFLKLHTFGSKRKTQLFQNKIFDPSLKVFTTSEINVKIKAALRDIIRLEINRFVSYTAKIQEYNQYIDSNPASEG